MSWEQRQGSENALLRTRPGRKPGPKAQLRCLLTGVWSWCPWCVMIPSGTPSCQNTWRNCASCILLVVNSRASSDDGIQDFHWMTDACTEVQQFVTVCNWIHDWKWTDNVLGKDTSRDMSRRCMFSLRLESCSNLFPLRGCKQVVRFVTWGESKITFV